MTCVNGSHNGSVLCFLNCFFTTENALLLNFNLPPVLSTCTYVAISIPRFKLNCAHTHFLGSVLLRGGIFILVTPSTRSYQVPKSQLDNSTPCLYTHFACTYLAISAQRFKLNCKHSHFPGPSLLGGGVFTLLTPSISCVYSYTFLAVSWSV